VPVKEIKKDLHYSHNFCPLSNTELFNKLDQIYIIRKCLNLT